MRGEKRDRESRFGKESERANKKNIRVVSDTQDLSDARRVKEDYVVQPGDIITVEEGFF